VAFRDSFDQCPRCGITLEDAQSARGCRGCNGMFLDEPVLSEMILEMLPPPPRAYGPLALSEVKRTGTQLACPSCKDAMKPTTIHEVELDHCAKHGVWFDQDELRITLYRVALPDNPPPFREWEPAPTVPPVQAPRAKAAPKVEPTARRLTFVMNGESITTQIGVIKIGKLASAALRIQDDEVSRLHAVIEVNRDDVTLIDLGSTTGSYVNGERVTKTKLQDGDTMRFGRTEVQILT
jgi:Zn-finger nucleic acid-binding protein